MLLQHLLGSVFWLSEGDESACGGGMVLVGKVDYCDFACKRLLSDESLDCSCAS